MWFQRLWFKRRLRKLTARGIPETPSHETLTAYVPVLDPQLLGRYHPHNGLKVTIEVIYANVTDFLEALDRAIVTIREGRSVKHGDRKLRRVDDGLRVCRLDDFLINAERHPVSFTEVIDELRQQLLDLDRVLVESKEQAPFQYKYYLRQYTHLMRETHEILRGLLEAI